MSAHPARVAAGQVIVDGHDVDALPFTGEPRDGRNSGQRLAFARLHLRDAAAGEGQRAAKLHIDTFPAPGSATRLPPRPP